MYFPLSLCEITLKHALMPQSRTFDDRIHMQEQPRIPARKVVQEAGGKSTKVPLGGGLEILIVVFLDVSQCSLDLTRLS